jgi:alkylhydroperoxidase/carboxymuconolactone decarboxylase family protein YurZ
MGIQTRVEAAVRQLSPTCTLDAINDVLAAAFVDLFKIGGYAVDLRSSPGLYTEAIRRGFYATGQQMLRPEYRECAVVALLASEEAEANLALHLFIALMAGIAADDVVDIIFLTGVYCGVNVLTKSLRVVAKTFDAIIAAADARLTAPAKVFEKILSEFPDPMFDEARKRLREFTATPY